MGSYAGRDAMLGLCLSCRRSYEEDAACADAGYHERVHANHSACKTKQDCCFDRAKELPCRVKVPCSMM